MKANLRTRLTRAFAFASLAFIFTSSHAETPKCEQIANDVRAAVAKDPGKVLMIVEDALVINEPCACEIVKAAISASKADAAKVQEIVQTAIAVAPKMSAIITECAGVSSGAVDAASESSAEKSDEETATSPKNPGGKNPKAPITPSVVTSERDPLNASGEGGSSSEGGYTAPVRSIFLVNQPAALLNTGGGSSSDEDDDDDDGGNKDGEDRSNRANSRRTRNLVPLSPSVAVNP